MIKNSLIYIAVVFLLACGLQAPPLKAANVTITNNNYPYSTTTTIDTSGDWPACNSTIKTLCITGFKIYDSTGSPYTVIGTMTNPPTPVGVQTWSQSFLDSTLTYGNHSVVVTVLYLDASGNPQEGAYSAPVNYVYNPGAPPTASITVVAK